MRRRSKQKNCDVQYKDSQTKTTGVLTINKSRKVNEEFVDNLWEFFSRLKIVVADRKKSRKKNEVNLSFLSPRHLPVIMYQERKRRRKKKKKRMRISSLQKLIINAMIFYSSSHFFTTTPREDIGDE